MRHTLILDDRNGATFSTLLLVEGETPYLYQPPLMVEVDWPSRGGVRIWAVEVHAGPPAMHPHCAHDRKQHDVRGCTWTDADGSRRCWCASTYMSLRPIAAGPNLDCPVCNSFVRSNETVCRCGWVRTAEVEAGPCAIDDTPTTGDPDHGN